MFCCLTSPFLSADGSVRGREPNVVLVMGVHSALQDVDCFAGAFGRKQCSRKIEIVAACGKRVDPHSPFYPRNCRLWITQEGQINTTLYDETWVIGIECQRVGQMVVALGK